MFVWYKVCFVRPGGNLRWVSVRAKFGDTFKLFLCSCTCHRWNFVTTGNTQTHPILMKASDNFTSFTEQLLHFLCENEKGKGIAILVLTSDFIALIVATGRIIRIRLTRDIGSEKTRNPIFLFVQQSVNSVLSIKPFQPVFMFFKLMSVV